MDRKDIKSRIKVRSTYRLRYGEGEPVFFKFALEAKKKRVLVGYTEARVDGDNFLIESFQTTNGAGRYFFNEWERTARALRRKALVMVVPLSESGFLNYLKEERFRAIKILPGEKEDRIFMTRAV